MKIIREVRDKKLDIPRRASRSLISAKKTAILSHAIGRKVNYVSVSEEEYRQEMKDSGIGDW